MYLVSETSSLEGFQRIMGSGEQFTGLVRTRPRALVIRHAVCGEL